MDRAVVGIGCLAIGLVIGAFTLEAHRRQVAVQRVERHGRGARSADGRTVRSAAATLERRWWPAWVVGLTALALLLPFGSAPLPVRIAFASVLGVLAHLVEGARAHSAQASAELQLADAIDLMVSTLQAGAGLLGAFEAAAREARAPLGPVLDEVASRMRLGDDPADIFGELPERLPLEGYRLLALALLVHWETGGSLAPSLALVGRSVRDRQEVARRVQAQLGYSQVSVVLVVAVAYVIAFGAYLNDPANMRGFLNRSAGVTLATLVIGLQALGLLWMERVARIEV